MLRVLLLAGCVLSFAFAPSIGEGGKASSPTLDFSSAHGMDSTALVPPSEPDFVVRPAGLIGIINTSSSGWSSGSAWAIQDVFVMAPGFMSPSGESWDLGDGLSENQTGTTNFTSSNEPDFDHVAAMLTDGINETIELDTWWYPSGGGSGTTAYETYWFSRTPDFVGFRVDFIRLVITSISVRSLNGGTQVDETFAWEVWGHRAFVVFIPPTDPDGAYLIDRRSTTINVSLAAAGNAVLSFNGVNQTMLGSGTQWHLTVNGLPNGVDTYQAWARDSAGSVFATEVRRLTVGVGIWTTLPVGYGFMPSLAYDADGFPRLCFYGGDISGNTGLVYATLSSNQWVNQSLEGTSGSTGQQCSIAFDRAGVPHISYLEGPDYGGNFLLKHAYLRGGSWAFETVAGGSYTQTSIAIDPISDQPRIAYYVVPSGGLMLASDDNGTWSSQTVDAGYAGFNPSLALDALGRPRIAYSAGLTSELRYAEWTGTSWAISVLDPSFVRAVSLKIDRNGTSHVAYSNGTGLIYASGNGPTWSKEVVDIKNFFSVALALDAADNPHVGYAMGWSGDVRYAVRDGSWKIQVVSHNVGGTGIAMGLDPSGYAGFAFETNRSNGNLVFATDIVDTLPPATTPLLHGRLGTNGWYTSAVSVTLNAADWSGVATTSYRLDGGPWTIYGGPFAVQDDGNHTIQFLSTDFSGNVEVVRSVTLDIDATPPTISSVGPAGTVTANPVPLTWDGADATSGIAKYQISLDGHAFESAGKAMSLAVQLADGPHQLDVQAFDEAGNSANATVRFQVDTYAFSFGGPYHGIPLLILVTAIAATPPLAYALYSRRKKT